MGISTHYYTIHGIKLDWNDDFDEAYDEVYEDHDTPFVLWESYGGSYLIIGTVLYDSGDLRWGDTKDVFVEIDIDGLEDIEQEYKKQFNLKFPKFKSLTDQKFKLMTLVHYS